MNPDLVCKIVVTQGDGDKKVRGTGYPIAADRVITAAHVVKDVATTDHPIQLVFGEAGEAFEPGESISVLWNGTNSDPPIDVAVLACPLPRQLQPTDLTMLRTRLRAPVAWQAQGYSEIAKKRMANGLHDYGGLQFPKVTSRSKSKELSCNNGPEREQGKQEGELWGGVSGSGVFEASGLQRLLAVVTDYVSNEKLPALRVVPLPYLFAQDGFRNAIGFDETVQTRLEHVKAARLALIKHLSSLGESIAELQKELAKIVTVDMSDNLPRTVAEGVLACESDDIPELLGMLRRLSRSTLKQHATSLAAIAQVALPLNYASDINVGEERHVTQAGKLWLVEGKTKTATLAEIIMAGFDCAPTNFAGTHVVGEDTELRSPIAFDFSHDAPPTEGPDPNFQNVYNFLRQLLNLTSVSPSTPTLGAAQIQALRAELETRKDEWGDRTTYCIVLLPKDVNERRARWNVLEGVANKVNPENGPPRLVFVEKVEMTDEDDCGDIEPEFQIQSSFKQLLLRAHTNDTE